MDSRDMLPIQRMTPSPITSSLDLLFHRDSLSGTRSILGLLTTVLIEMQLEAMTTQHSIRVL
jgi:hypothetical protein